jgi:serine/threonine protein kinase/predicted ATPase
VTRACPPDSELERLLADQLSAAQEQALEAHVVDCAACQGRLEQFTCGRLTLPAQPAGPERDREDTPPPAGVLERVANLLPAQVRHLAQPASAADTPDPVAGRREAAPSAPAGNPREPEVDPERATAPTPEPAPRAAGAPPAAFGRYPVRRTLGTGGFGTVYLGHDTQLDRPVAIKVFRSGPGGAPAENEPLLREARRLARLRHPGIVTVHDVGVHEGRVYLVSDFLDGPSLGEWLKDNRPSWQEAARLAAAVADALAHAHARRTVHRDVKPANILLTAGRTLSSQPRSVSSGEKGWGEGGTPVLVDFGLALDEAEAGGREKGVVSGTPWYMSPEQVAGAAHRIDGRTDIYSLGVVLYEMLCGRVPFRSPELLELLRQVRDDEPQPPRQLVPDLPPELERVCLKALAKRLQDRYTTAADFAADLRRAVPAPAEPEMPPAARSSPSATPAGAGQRAPPSPPSRRKARAAERRQVTVLVCGCNLFDSEEFLERLDAEDQARVLREFREACEQVSRRFDGTVVQSSNGGLLLCFGYPVAQEDAARRAVLAGLAILEDVQGVSQQLRSGLNVELKPWVGIHTGPAVVEAAENAISLVGEARNVAVRLGEVAEPGQVVCTEAAHRLLQGQFDCLSLGSWKVKGVPQSLELFRVQGVVPGGNPIELARRTGLTPLTGRDHEVSLLKDRWQQAQEGMGQVVLLVGESGLGKSRLVYVMKQHVQGPGGEAASPSIPSRRGRGPVGVIEWRCSPHYQNTGLYPAIDFFERLLVFDRADDPAGRFRRLVRHLEEYDLARPDVVPLFAALLSLPADDRFPPLGLSPVREREETFRALREWLRAYVGRRPVLFIVEDLHWVDASTLEFLGQFVAEGLHDRLLTLLTFRPEFHTPWPAVAHQTSLALNRLTRRQVGELMRKKTGADDLPETLVEQVYDRTDGVPLFVEEFTRLVQESGVLEGAGEGGAPGPVLPAHEIPATLQDLVMARLDRREGDREVVQLAAALGREFSYELLAAVVAANEPALQAELAKLVQAEILLPKGRPPRCSYLFKHALLQDAAYNSLVKVKRQQFHRRIAEVLEARFPQTVETQPEILAHHCTEAGLTEQAVGLWLKAGLRSRERSAEVEAIGHLTTGLELLGRLEESPARDARELEFLNALGTAYSATRGYGAPEVGAAFRRARELCERIGQPQQLFAVSWSAWAWHCSRGELLIGMDLAGRMRELAEHHGDPGVLMEALFVTGWTRFCRGDFAGARDDLARALDHDDRARTKAWAARTGQDAGVTVPCTLSLVLWLLGYPDQGRKLHREAVELGHTLDHPFSHCYALYNASCLSLLCRLGTEVEPYANEAIRIAADQGFPFWHASTTIFKAAALTLRGHFEEGLPLFRESLAAVRAVGTEIVHPYYLGLFGEACLRAGRFEDALRSLEQGLALADKNDERWTEAELHRLKGELLLAEPGDDAGAEACFRQALAIARRQQSKAWELRATLSLARLWQRQGRRDDACAALVAVYGTYTEGFTTPDLVDARALLEALA